MSRRLRISLFVIAMLIGGSATYAWQHRDPTPAITVELRAAASDPSNHATYADLIRQERAIQGHLSTATFATPCFWSGEARFGLLDGVYRTTPGYLDGHEVVRVEYDPALIDYDMLQTHADPTQALDESHDAVCTFNAAASRASRDDKSFHPDDQPKWYLQQTALKTVPMTPAQATRVNAYLHVQRPIDSLLSPMQQALWSRAKMHSPDDRPGYSEIELAAR